MENEKTLNGNAEETQEIYNKQIKEQIEIYATQQSHAAQLTRWEPPQQSPREYLHNFLLQAKNVGCNVDGYILDEIKKMYIELER